MLLLMHFCFEYNTFRFPVSILCDISGLFQISNPTKIYLFKVNNRSSRKMCEICSKLTIKTPERSE